ncbi:MAG TPA: lipocalin-like domain-containing protein [Steroidobacteraceae bacterium]|nr:lipocalin-like domain-containing protein [Steroidobacteraceae bacterium]
MLGMLAAQIMAAAGSLSELDVLRGVRAKSGFELALAPREFHFPLDHGPHPTFRHEWWYVTGNLDAAGGARFGFELTFFRFALAPGNGTDTPARSQQSRWRARQIYLAHFAVTDVELGVFEFAQKYSREALGLAGAQAEPFRVWLDDWTLGGGGGSWNLSARGQGYELSLDAQLLGAPVLNGQAGLSRKSDEPGAASYYYSVPRMAVTGRLVRGGHPMQVHGLAWLDREWGSGALGPHQQGWDWFALQLHNGGTLMFYALRDGNGARDPHSAGTWVSPTGEVRAIASEDVQIEVLDHWVSPRGGRYPSRWRMRVPVVGIDVEIRPVLANQELVTRPRYWEGAVDVSSAQGGSAASGRGYVELVGYGE